MKTYQVIQGRDLFPTGFQWLLFLQWRRYRSCFSCGKWLKISLNLFLFSEKISMAFISDFSWESSFLPIFRMQNEKILPKFNMLLSTEFLKSVLRSTFDILGYFFLSNVKGRPRFFTFLIPFWRELVINSLYNKLELPIGLGA